VAQTYSGPFLVAVNPYRDLDGYYSPQAVAQYMNRRREENPPHIFAVAQQAWAQMISERESQSILVTCVIPSERRWG
jgi:myosin protein heavy chain